MKVLRTLLNELAGMFVDDGSLAIAILVIVAVAGWVSIRFVDASLAVAVMLTLGCASALIENVVRTAQKAHRS